MPEDGENIGEKAGASQPFFSGGEGDPAASYGDTGLRPGARIGAYKLLGVLGEGGYGIVYLAEQERPIRRKVALKIVKPGMDSREVIARFEAERQALALLDHPNIAHVFTAGTTGTGRPYFAMEYIEGHPITEYCDRKRLSIRQRLSLFMDICNAVHHAHQKGIIHRDIKPSNILVSAEDGEPLAKVIDFGVAKALTQSLTDRTLYTEQGQFIGTPDYMSPEQAELDARSVDTRSDIYSLGVVLYELLTGVLPFDPQELRAGGVSHIRAVIQGQEPKTPSTRLTNLGEKSHKVAERRRTDPQTLARSLRRELEWIPLKAMRKDSSRRYQSVSDFAGDVDNYLRGRPLLAGPESTSYRVRKFAGRHKTPIAAAAAVFLTLVITLAVSAAMYFRAETARDTAVKAEAAEQKQRKVADAARTEAETRLADLYENQGRNYLAAGEFDKALVFLGEACKIEATRLSVRLALQEGLRKHEDPNLRWASVPSPWQGIEPSSPLPFCVSPDRGLVAFVDNSAETIYVQRTDTGEQVSRIEASNVLCLAFTTSGRYVVAKVHKDQQRHTLKAYDVRQATEVFSADRQSVDIDDVCRLAGADAPERRQLELAYGGVLIPPEGDWFAYVDVAGEIENLEVRVHLWDFAAHELHTSQYDLLGHLVIGMGYRTTSAYGSTNALIIIDRERQVHCWGVPNLKFYGEFAFGASSGAFAVDGKRCLVFDRQKAVLVDRSTNRNIKQFQGTDGFGFSPDGGYAVTKRVAPPSSDAATATSQSCIDVWDADEADYVVGLSGTPIENWHFAPDSRRLVTEHKGGEIRVWNLKDSRPVFEIPAGDNQVVADVSPHGSWLLTRSRDAGGFIRLYDLDGRYSFEPHECKSSGPNLNAKWTCLNADRIFAFSRMEAAGLPFFNQDGSGIITPAGLVPIGLDDETMQKIPPLLAASIPLRLEQGRLRPASTKEILEARTEYSKLTDGLPASEAIRRQIDLATYEMETGNLGRAMELVRNNASSRSSSELIEDEQETIRTLARAYLARGELGERQGRYMTAMADYRDAMTLMEDDPKILNALAWLLATCADFGLRNGGEALELAGRACEATAWRDWRYVATYAAACAEMGLFTDAAAFQEKAISLLPPEEQPGRLAGLRERARLYRAGQRYDRRRLLDLLGTDLIARWDFEPNANADPRSRSAAGRLARLNWNVESLGTPQGAVLKFYGDGGYANCGPLSLPEPIGAITASVWGRWDDEERDDRWPTVAAWGHSWRLFRSPETRTFAFECGGLSVPNGGLRSCAYGQTPLYSDGKWHHLAGVYNGAQLYVYLDGVLDGSAGATGDIPRFGGSVWGGNGRSVSTPWKGMVDDVRVYAAALSHEEIAGLYDRGRARYETTFFVDAGKTQVITLPLDAVQVRATVSTNDGEMPANQLRFSWALSTGPQAVQFIPRDDVHDPCVILPAPGVYELRCTVERDGLKAHDTVPIVVYPHEFNGLVAHYTFDRDDASDNSGQSIHGALRGDAHIVRDEQRGNVLRLDGDGDYVECGADPRFNMEDGATVAAWVKVVSFDMDYQSIVTKGNCTWALHRHRGTDLLCLCCANLDGFDSWSRAIGTTAMNDGAWHHAVGTYDGAHVRMYVDDRQEGVLEVAGRLRVSDEPVLIGENGEETGRSWNGWIDDVRIYNRAMNDEEVARLYEQTK